MKIVTERANDLTYTGAMGFKGEMNKAGSYTHYVFGRYHLQRMLHIRLQVHLEQFETTIPLEKSLREK